MQLLSMQADRAAAAAAKSILQLPCLLNTMNYGVRSTAAYLVLGVRSS
jgi:hypothetical protein